MINCIDCIGYINIFLKENEDSNLNCKENNFMLVIYCLYLFFFIDDVLVGLCSF